MGGYPVSVKLIAGGYWLSLMLPLSMAAVMGQVKERAPLFGEHTGWLLNELLPSVETDDFAE